nr:MAG TPA: hypothetical protein [Caudoviricetes sp.]
MIKRCWFSVIQPIEYRTHLYAVHEKALMRQTRGLIISFSRKLFDVKWFRQHRLSL